MRKALEWCWFHRGDPVLTDGDSDTRKKSSDAEECYLRLFWRQTTPISRLSWMSVARRWRTWSRDSPRMQSERSSTYRTISHQKRKTEYGAKMSGQKIGRASCRER